jgi:phenylalanyl-tRNA synthetase beta subunit
VVVNGTWVGCFGEIDPHVGDAFELAVPMNAAEFDMAALDAALPDPV